MTLTVRLDGAIESALERYCADRGVTKSLVVQESLAVYLFDKAAARGAAAAVDPVGDKVSDNYKAFEKAGFIGAGAIGGPSATNAVVRERVLQHLRRKRA